MFIQTIKFIKTRLFSFYRYCNFFRDRIKARNKTKYFCIGRNKTGTTSLEKAFKQLGYPVGYQRKAEKLYDQYYFEGDFEPIIKYCRSAQVFQDVPFSCPETFKHLDKAYPGSKFILTVRDEPEHWYRSIIRFHSKKFGQHGRIPTAQDLKESFYVTRGMPYNTVRLHGTFDNDPYNKGIMVAHYERYNQDVIEYFKNRSSDLLVLNLSEENAYKKFIDFLGVKSPHDTFPWENRS